MPVLEGTKVREAWIKLEKVREQVRKTYENAEDYEKWNI